MKSFSPKQCDRTIPMGLAWLAGSVMEFRGRQDLYEHQKPELLSALREVAIIQSTESSNRIEGVTVERDRLKPLVLGRVAPRDRSEEDLVGYRRALSWIHSEHETIELNPESLQQLHRLAQQASGDAGQWKQVDNAIMDVLPDGRRQLRFQTVTVEETPAAIDELCRAYHHVLEQGLLPPMFAIASLVLDFLCIHPFRDGNGRVARLLTLLLLYHHGCRVGRYISLERLIEESKESYYEVLARASTGWHEAEHDPTPWWSYFLSTTKRAYQELEARMAQLESRPGWKTQAVELAINRLPSSFGIADVLALCPKVSRALVRKTLRRLRDEGSLRSVGTGRAAIWQKHEQYSIRGG